MFLRSPLTAVQVPAQPVAVTADDILRESVTVVWTIPNQSCTPEEYVVQFGLTPNALDEESDRVFGTGDPLLINTSFSVQLTGLREGTTYHYRVVTSNAIQESIGSSIQQFTTMEPVRSKFYA